MTDTRPSPFFASGRQQRGRCRVQFDRVDLGVELVRDTDLMPACGSSFLTPAAPPAALPLPQQQQHEGGAVAAAAASAAGEAPPAEEPPPLTAADYGGTLYGYGRLGRHLVGGRHGRASSAGFWRASGGPAQRGVGSVGDVGAHPDRSSKATGASAAILPAGVDR